MIVDFSSLSPGRAYRFLISAIVPRPIAFISSLSPDGVQNLAPFSYFMGVGCILKDGNSLSLVDAIVLSAPKSKPLYDRLAILGKNFETFLDSHHPDEVAIEDVFHG